MSWTLFFMILILALVVGLIAAVLISLIVSPRKKEYFDENTMFIVRDALESSGLDERQVNAAIVWLLDAGILFRERVTEED